MTLVLRSRYLLGICLFMALASVLGTFVYFSKRTLPDWRTPIPVNARRSSP
jgi:ATP/ADP translocase